ncbi:hypothetical protein [Solwaraspora sp. WMMD792]|uniref:hypothetical protein n=1 Tax=Solwaraspora sp. WMMD792 TaxID=3016099 RepID=UPI0024164E47|nr:hypothetical protein [Solwaraspora sp. WMMD792]MDG4771791.1 hypothetical protein [Solwaraspora sp. WMMD792]
MARLNGPYRLAPVALALAVLVGGCGGGSSLPELSPPAFRTTTAEPTPTPTGPRYGADGLDLCQLVDLDPLAALAVTVESTDPTPPRATPGAACLFKLVTRSGHLGSLRVEAATPATVADAERLYRDRGEFTVMLPEGGVPGLGDQAAAFARRTEPGFKYAEYMIHVRLANLMLLVWLAVGGNEFVPTAQLAAPARTIAEAALALVPHT